MHGMRKLDGCDAVRGAGREGGANCVIGCLMSQGRLSHSFHLNFLLFNIQEHEILRYKVLSIFHVYTQIRYDVKYLNVDKIPLFYLYFLHL